MNKKQAFEKLQLPSSASQDEIKKKFKELSRKLHPDINKEPDAEAKFKEINEAHQILTSKKTVSRSQSYNQPFVQFEHIQISATISFKEAVLGTTKDIKYNRNIKCESCNGNGQIALNNGCDKCGGRGLIIINHGHTIFQQTCNKCYGKAETKSCDKCLEECILNVESTRNVIIPAGIHNNTVLRVQGKGNFIGSIMGLQDQYTDIFILLNVIPEQGLSIVNSDVVSNIKISLLDALKGRTIQTNTIDGLKDISIKPLSKNNDCVLIPNLGVANKGFHKTIIEVEYPQNTDELINLLSKDA